MWSQSFQGAGLPWGALQLKGLDEEMVFLAPGVKEDLTP